MQFPSLLSLLARRSAALATIGCALSGCAVVSVATTTVSVAATGASLAVSGAELAVDAAVGAAKVTGKVAGAAVDAVLPGGGQ